MRIFALIKVTWLQTLGLGILTLADDALLLAAHTASKQLKLYSLKIDWHMQKPGETAPNPATLSLQHLITLDICVPSFNGPDSAGGAPLATTRELEMSHLKLLPRPPDPPDETNAVPIVLGVFSRFSDVVTDASLSYSVISRWELREEKATVDSSFTKINTKKINPSELKVLPYCWVEVAC